MSGCAGDQEVEPGAALDGGSEGAAAAAPAPAPRITELPADGHLTWAGFLNVYRSEVYYGKYWGVSWDMSKCGFPLPHLPEDTAPAAEGETAEEALLRQHPRFRAHFDHIFVLSADVLAVRDTGGDRCDPLPLLLPNGQHPSDHLPVGVVIRVPEERPDDDGVAGAALC